MNKKEIIARYNEAHKEMFKVKYPSVWNDNLYSAPKFPTVAKSTGLTTFCVNYCQWSGHHLERTNTMGVPTKKIVPKFDIFAQKLVHVDTGKMEWRKGTGIKGSSDLKGHINNPKHKFPIPVYIEIKIKDKQSDYQKEYEKQVTKTGALYAIVHNPEEFFIFIDYVMQL
jgi:hypothetical protein